MRLFELEDDKLQESMLQHLRTPLSDCADSLIPPPLATLSVSSSDAGRGANSSSSANCSDDSSSVSSVSIEEDAWDESEQSLTEPSQSSSHSTAKRSIFASYWNKKGGRPQVSLRTTSDDETSISSSSSVGSHSSCEHNYSYEGLLEKNESPASGRRADDSSSCAAGRRRSIFAATRYVSQSESCLPQCLTAVEALRKTKSASAVVGPKPSCLRESRYSRGSSRRPSSSSSKVSFSEEVEVQYLKPVTERYSEKGWSKYFM